jgi:hypothetical protein
MDVFQQAAEDDFNTKLLVLVLNKYLKDRNIEITTADLDAYALKHQDDCLTLRTRVTDDAIELSVVTQSIALAELESRKNGKQ